MNKRKRFSSVVVISYELIMQIIFLLPRYKILNNLKAGFLRLLGAKIGDSVTFYPNLWISFAPGNILEIGDNVDLATGVLITTKGGVTIKERTLIGYRTQILSSNHIIPLDSQPIFSSGHEHSPVMIDKDVWIGANCIILPGITVGEGAVIGAGSVVTKSVPPWTIVAGVPARIVRKRSLTKEKVYPDAASIVQHAS
jgi:acetyltransferase-like isoleucine patch superfamily enzyme